MPRSDTSLKTSPDHSQAFGRTMTIPGILVAYAPTGACAADRCVVRPPFTVGRSSSSSLTVFDDKTSKEHLRIFQTKQGFWIEDLGSTNGTFVAGNRLLTKQPLTGPTVIRAGRAVLVFHPNAGSLIEPQSGERFGIAGAFHAGPFVEQLRDAVRSGRHLLLTGPTGTGKELAANAVAILTGGGNRPLDVLIHNAARFASAEEAATTLFGVEPRVFSGVDERPGMIERAHGGILFLDEVHNLPEQVQRGLLRVMEDGKSARIGESQTRPVDVRFVLATNVKGPSRGLAHDLYARLREVELTALKERVADIPDIFRAVLSRSMAQLGLTSNPVDGLLGPDHFEALCLDGFPALNVRGLVDIADRIASRVAGGGAPEEALAGVFSERFGDGPVALRHLGNGESANHNYEQNRDHIIAAYRECGGNLSATERLLKSRGLPCSRRWIGIYIERWDVRISKP